MKDITQILSEAPLFKGLPEDQILAIRRIAIPKEVKKNEIIFSEKDEGNGFYIIGDGVVKIFKVSSEGKEQILHILATGEPFGEVAALTGQPFPAHAEAITAAQLLFLPKEAFINLINRHPSLAINIIALLCLRLHQFAGQVESLSLKEVPNRLASYLIYLLEEQGKEDKVFLSISKGQLASLLGTIPETLSRIFGRMTEQRLIEVDGKLIRILDRESLKALSEQ